jgi:hypothetical protein
VRGNIEPSARQGQKSISGARAGMIGAGPASASGPIATRV